MTYINNIHELKARRKFLRNNASSQERKLWNVLKNSNLGFKFRRQHSFGYYIVDFYCYSKKLIIEIDGENHSSTDQLEYDNERKYLLENLGLKEIRFANKEIDNDLENVIIKICKVLKE